MKPWETLTERGRFRRLRAVAIDALRHYRLDVEQLRFVGGYTNALFRVDAVDGARYALRVDLLCDHSDSDAVIEAAWLAELERAVDSGDFGPNLDVCRIVPAADGSPFVHGAGPGVPGARRCTLFRWAGGRPLGDSGLSPERYHHLGRASALLHRHGATFTPPERPMRWDRVFYWPEEVDPVVHDHPEHAELFTGDRRDVFDAAIAAVGTAFDRLDPTQAQIIHADLHPWNVMVRANTLTLIDFEDVACGHPVQDVALTLTYERSNARYPQLRAAFEAGYRSIWDWPETWPGEIEHFMTARVLMLANFVLNVDRDEAADYFDRIFPVLRTFLDQR